MNKLLLLLLLQIFAVDLTAESFSAHTHGEATLLMVYDQDRLQLELETPAANILGFEHAPKNKDQKERYKKALQVLNSPAELFTIKPECSLDGSEIEAPFAEARHADKPHAKVEDHAAEHKEHDNHDHDEGHEEHHDNDHQEHEDFIVRYEWVCKSAKELKVTLNLFAHFPGFEKITAQWIAYDKQNSVIANKANTLIEIAP